MRLHKNFKIGKLNYLIFMKVYNLLDRRNTFFNDTGRAGYTYVFQSTQETQGLKATMESQECMSGLSIKLDHIITRHQDR